jgi:hypothetical protein
VRRKNRKLRRLRELYPDIKVKLFYGKDFRALMLKYGRFYLAASLSGLEGQLTPMSVGQPKLALTVPAAAATASTALALVGANEVADEATSSEVAIEATSREAPLAALMTSTRSRPRVSRGSRRRRGRRAFLAARNS